MNTTVKALAGIVIIAVLAVAGWIGWTTQQKRAQQQQVVRVLGEATEGLREALAKSPSPELLARMEAAIQAAKAPRDRALEDAAELYLVGARELTRRRADAARLTAEADAARKALAAHMSHSSRASSWYSDATRLKKQVEQTHADLGRTLKAVEELLVTMPDAEKRLAPHVSRTLLLDAAARDAARKQVQVELQNAAAELEKARALAPR